MTLLPIKYSICRQLREYLVRERVAFLECVIKFVSSLYNKIVVFNEYLLPYN